jgi:hypothetical protein
MTWKLIVLAVVFSSWNRLPTPPGNRLIVITTAFSGAKEGSSWWKYS